MAMQSWGRSRAFGILVFGLALSACSDSGSGDGPSGATVSFLTNSVTLAENAGSFNLRVVLSTPAAEDLSIPFSVAGTASSADVTAPLSPLVIPAGAIEASIPLTIVDDNILDPGESLTVALGSPAGTVLGSPSSFTLNITDNEVANVSNLRFTLAGQAVPESAGTVTVAISVSPAAAQAITLPFTVSGSANAQDATVPSSPLTIAAGATTASINVVILNDSVDENDAETLVLSLGTPSAGGRLFGGPSVHTITIGDDDLPAAPVVQLGSAAQTVAENAGVVMVPVQVASPAAQAISLPYTVTGSAVAADRTVPLSPLIIAAGATTASIPITVVDDTDNENNETVILTLGAPSGPAGVSLGTTTTFALTVTDNDTGVSSVRFSSAAQTAAETAGAVMLAVQITPAATQALTVPITVSGTAGATDRTVTPSSLSIPVGATTANLTVTIANDTEAESNETVIVTLGAPTPAAGGALGTPAALTLTITDDDTTQPTLRFSAATQTVAENAGTGSATVQVTPAATTAITVPVTVGGTSAAGDRTVTTSLPLVILANATSAVINFTVTDDTEDENDETLILSLGTPTGATGVQVGTPAAQTVTITDNDTGPSSVSFAMASQTVAENTAGTFNLTVNISPAATQAFTVPFTLGGTADGGDRIVSSSPLSIPVGATAATIAVQILNDTASESNETVVLTLGAPSSATAATLGANAINVTTITDDDSATTPTISIAANQTVLESGGSASIAIGISPTSPTAITLPYTVGGTATGGADFSIAPTSPLTIPANTSNVSLIVTLLNDAGAEPDETVIVTLGQPSAGAVLGQGTVHTLTIDDDEGQAAPQGTLFAVTDGYRLLRFQASSPGAGVVAMDITGVLDLPPPDNFRPEVLALEFRPATGELYLYTADRRFYRLDPNTAAATLIGTAAVGTANINAVDFNPCPDRIRMLGTNRENFRLMPDGSLAGRDTDLSYAPSEPNPQDLPAPAGVAYTACNGTTTAYVIDDLRDVLLTLGSVNGTPTSPNSGQLFTVGPLGISIGGASQGAFDINTVSNEGYTTDSDGTNTTLYRVNLATGALTALGLIDDPDPAQTSVRVSGMAVQP